jgi:hypothetical protein
MGKQFAEITPDLQGWISSQRMFFVATAPRSDQGLLNCSPKGMDTFRVLGPTEVGYLDLTGSGIETAAHLAENGRIVFMFCAFKGAPKVLRLHGVGEYHLPTSAAFREVRGLFPELPGTRGIVRARLSRISDSCGWAVPRYDFVNERDTLVRWSESEGPAGLENFRADLNIQSVDGLPGYRARTAARE